MFKYIIIGVFLISLTGCGKIQQQVVQAPISIPPGMIYFFSPTCQHCAIVKEYIETNNISTKLFFVSRDISSDKDAFSLIQEVGRRCGITENRLAVPLFWDGSSCYLGDDRVIEYFKSLPQ